MKIKKILAIITAICIVSILVIGTIQAVYANNSKSSSTSPFRIDSKTLTAYVGTDALVTLPNDVMIIGERAFENNTILTDIEFPDYITGIEYKAFYGCTGLDDITIPDTVTKIGPGAFMGCSELTYFQIGKSVKSWGSGVFNDCTKLSTIILSDENTYLTYWDGALYNGDMSFLYQVIPAREGENYVVPSETTSIDTYAFYNLQNVKNIRFAGKVTKIQDYAMKSMGSVENVILPDTVKSIGKKSFADNENLKQILIPASVTEISKDAFSGSENVSILTTKGSEAETFAKKYEIPLIYEKILPTDFVDSNPSGTDKPDLRKKIVVENTETTVEQLTDEITKVEEETKKEEEEASKKEEEEENKQPTFEESATESTKVIGKTKVVNGQAVFLMNNHSGSIYGDPYVEKKTGIDDLLAANAKVITESGTVDYNYTSILQRKYYNAKDIKDFVVEADIQNIGRLAFARSSIQSVVIPDTVVSIEYGAFYSCSKLNEVEIGDGVQIIATKVFEGTPWLDNWYEGSWGDEDFLIIGDNILLAYRGTEEDVLIPEGVKQIGPDAFKGNKNIISVEIPESVTKICMDAFKDCSKLETVKGCKGLETIVHGAFNDTAIDYENF